MYSQEDNLIKHSIGLGKVESISDGICLISGLNDISIDSIVLFPSGCRGLIIDFSGDFCSSLVLGDFTTVKKGDYVRLVERQLTVPVGEELLGRVIDPLGNALDDKGKIFTKIQAGLENKEKTVFQRKNISHQLQTGYFLIDSQIPIGCGQRELFIGEKRIGIEETAVNILVNQAINNTGVIVIYVTIGAQSSFIKRMVDIITEKDALKNTVIVVGRASDPAPLNYLAPFFGVRLAEDLAEKGKNVLVIFDNLTRHARVYRQISLLLKHAPGREAYPGDIFYLHARLLERCGCFDDQVGGGSITAIPIVETVGEDITDYITTNLMSITDGHVLFLRSLFHKDRRPAISVEYSVSRVGGKAQSVIFRDLSNELKIKIGRYNELEALTSFGTELQKETKMVIERGKRIFSFINQDNNANFTIIEQSAIIYFLLSDYIMQWPAEIMLDLSNGFSKFISQPDNKNKLAEAFHQNSLELAKPIYEEICKAFLNDPVTIRPLVREGGVANKESLQDLLKQMDKKDEISK